MRANFGFHCWPRSKSRVHYVRSLRLLFLIGLLIGGVPAAHATASTPTGGSSGTAYAGWAMDAYPNLQESDFVQTLTRMKAAGANLVWIGHNNPVSVDPNAKEVGLSYAVYQAATNSADPNYGAAQSILAAQTAILQAARTVGIKVVLPVGYQLQMGTEWNATHQSSLRRAPDGSLIDFGGIDASPYDAQFRTDSTTYYQWVDQHFVQPYRDVIQMVMITDEPSGFDYSSDADAVFYTTYGFHLADAGGDVTRETDVGRFEAHIMDDYAVWAANTWQQIDPALTVTITFDGSPARNNQLAPALKDLFAETPSNFIPTWDAQIRNGPPTEQLNDSDVTSLAILVGTIARLSAEYHKSYWLWSSGNSWGLSGGSPVPGTIDDALANLHMLADISKEAGGLLGGIAIWAYNVRGQGLYNDSYHPPYDPNTLFTTITQDLPAIRAILEGPSGPGPDALILAPDVLAYRMIDQGPLVDNFSFRAYNFGDFVSLVRTGLTTSVVDSLQGKDLSHIRILVVAARDPGDITSQDIAIIKAYRSGGGIVVDGTSVDAADGLNAQYPYVGDAPELFFAKEFTEQSTGPVAALGFSRLTNSFVFTGPLEQLIYGGTETDTYGVARAAYPQLPSAAMIINYDASGAPTDPVTVGPGGVAIATQLHTVSLITTSANIDSAATDRFFAQTQYGVPNDAIWNYFMHRGGVRVFGYPISRTFVFEGFVTQLFQRAAIQLTPDGQARTLNLLDAGLLPYTHFNGSVFPAPDPALIATAPTPADATYGADAIAWTLANAPNTWQGLPVDFGRTFSNTVTIADAFPNGGADPSLLPLLNLELWGLPTSTPQYDPANHQFIYERFQRGIMQFDASCNCTQGILLGAYLKAILTGHGLPPDLAREASASPLFGQYDPTAPGSVANPAQLLGTDMTGAFDPQ